jgi:hypothetical protein
LFSGFILLLAKYNIQEYHASNSTDEYQPLKYRAMDISNFIMPLLLGVFLIGVVFLSIRMIVLWYWKIYDIVMLLEVNAKQNRDMLDEIRAVRKLLDPTILESKNRTTC